MFFFFNDTATTEIYTLSLHDALPISCGARALPGIPGELRPGAGPRPEFRGCAQQPWCGAGAAVPAPRCTPGLRARSEEHTSELQSLAYLVCRLLLEKKK